VVKAEKMVNLNIKRAVKPLKKAASSRKSKEGLESNSLKAKPKWLEPNLAEAQEVSVAVLVAALVVAVVQAASLTSNPLSSRSTSQISTKSSTWTN
jgi:hypothetical protein